MPFTLDYYHGAESEQFSFIRIPKALFGDPYLSLSINARLLYSILLDRMSLSRRNNWIDDNNRVYIIYTTASLADCLKLSLNTISKLLHELDDVGLIERKRRGLGKPDLIFPKNFTSAVDCNLNIKTRRYCDTVVTDSNCPDTQDIVPINTNNTNTDVAIINPSITQTTTTDNANTDIWTRWIDYRSVTGCLPYDDILSSPSTIDYLITAIIGSNNYTDDAMHSIADMVPTALHSLLSSPTTSVCDATVVPMQVLRLIDNRIDTIDIYPYISIDNVIDTAINNYINGAQSTRIHHKLGYMRTCLYMALATGDADVDSDLLYGCR